MTQNVANIPPRAKAYLYSYSYPYQHIVIVFVMVRVRELLRDVMRGRSEADFVDDEQRLRRCRATTSTNDRRRQTTNDGEHNNEIAKRHGRQ